MRYAFTASGKTPLEIAERARRQVSEFAGDLQWSIEDIDINRRLMVGANVAYEIADVEAWIEDPL